MVNDSVGDFLARIKNALERKKKIILVPNSKILEKIGEILVTEGFIKEINAKEKDGRSMLEVSLKYDKKDPVIQGIKRVSKPGVRVYSGYKDVPTVLSGQGIVILTTSKGIMTGKSAKLEKVGGELLCKIW